LRRFAGVSEAGARSRNPERSAAGAKSKDLWFKRREILSAAPQARSRRICRANAGEVLIAVPQARSGNSIILEPHVHVGTECPDERLAKASVCSGILNQGLRDTVPKV
jgi:hypothetical protein